MNQDLGRETKKRWRILQINEQALRELSESQKQSTMKDILVSIKIRMIISKI